MNAESYVYQKSAADCVDENSNTLFDYACPSFIPPPLVLIVAGMRRGVT